MPYIQQKASMLFIIITTMMGVLTLLPSDIYLPALPMLQHDFNTTESGAGLTLSAFFLGAGISQIIAGPIVNTFNNKKITAIALIIFTLVSLLSIFSKTINILILYRFIQSFSAGFVVVVSRALVVELCTKEEALRVFLIMSPIIAVSPGIAPIIGGYISQYFGWKSSFVFITGFGLILTLLAVKYLPTSATQHSKTGHSSIIHTYIKLFKHKKFIIYLSLRTGIDASYFGYITASPFLFFNLGYTSAQIGKFYLLIAISYIVMTYVCNNLIKKKTIDMVIFLGMIISLIGVIFLALIGLFAIKSAILIIIAASIMTAGYGFAGPLSWSEAMAQFPQDSGVTSSLIGFMPLVGSALVASIINIVTNNSATRLAIALGVLLILPTIFHYIIILHTSFTKKVQLTNE